MKESDIQRIIETVEKTINKTVNGKIDRMDSKLETHIKEVRPIIDFLKGVKVSQKVVIFITSVVIAIAGAIVAVKGIFK